MDGSLVIMEGSSLLRFCYSNGWQPCHYGRQFVVEILLLQWMVALSLLKVVYCLYFVTLMDGSLVIMEGSLLSIFLLLQWMVSLSILKVLCCRYFCYSIGQYPCNYGRQSVVEIFDTPMEGSLIIMEGSLLSIFLLLQWMVALSL